MTVSAPHPVIDAARQAALRAFTQGRLPPGMWSRDLPRLRFDRVAQRVVQTLQSALLPALSETELLIVSITAPILLPARTVAELSQRLRDPVGRDFDETVCGNRVRAHRTRHRRMEGPLVIVFVHNPKPAPGGLFSLVEDSLSATRQGKRPAR
ncbi:MAG: hypothetical protein JSR67_08300 [Proteobacteria bacterium]|nr:hypothetical protein [Pseudomonadota bacterium]